MLENFETTISKATLLSELRSRLGSLSLQLHQKRGAYQNDLSKHVKHVATVLRQAAKEVESGKLKPDNGGWCVARRKIEERIGEVPESLSALENKIRLYEAAIFQVTHSRGDPMRVTTSQIESWLKGEPVVKGRRR